jgi:hypothetical protein
MNRRRPTPPTPPPAGADLCATNEVVCGANARCDPQDGACYCELGHLGDPVAGCVAHGEVCDEAAARVGHNACALTLPDLAAWTAISVAASQRRDTRRVGKYLAPIGPDAPLPTLFLDANYYALHFCLLKHAFAPQFPNFSFAQYQQLVYRRADRSMVAGTIYEFLGDDLPVRHGFTVETPDDPGELLDEPEVYAIARQLRERFGPGELGFVPSHRRPAEAAALGWKDPRFAVVLGGEDRRHPLRGLRPPAPPTAACAATAPGPAHRLRQLRLAGHPRARDGAHRPRRRHGRRRHRQPPGRAQPPQRARRPPRHPQPLRRRPARRLRRRTTASWSACAPPPSLYSVVPADLAEAEAFWAEHRPSVAIEHPPDPDFLELRRPPRHPDRHRQRARPGDRPLRRQGQGIGHALSRPSIRSIRHPASASPRALSTVHGQQQLGARHRRQEAGR